MWARHRAAGQPVLPDSLDDDDLQVVYDAPEQPQAEDGEVPALESPGHGGAFAQSAVKPRLALPAALPSPPGSPAQGRGAAAAAGSPGHTVSRPAGVQPDQLLGSDDVRALLQRTLEAVTQFSPAHQLDSELAPAAEPDPLAGGLGPTHNEPQVSSVGNASLLPRQQVQHPRQPPQQHLQEPQQHRQQGSGPPSARAGTLGRRPRQPPMHTSPAVPAPAPGPPAQLATAAGAKPSSGGRRWRPQQQASRQAQQDVAASSMRPQQQQRAGEQGLGPPTVVAGGAVSSAGFGWDAPMHAPLLCPPASAQPPAAGAGAVQGQLRQERRPQEPHAAEALGDEGCEQGDITAADFFRVDDDLLAVHLRMPPPEAAAVGPDAWRAAGKAGRAKQQRQQQQQQWQDSRATQAAALEPTPSQQQGGGGGGRNPLAALLDPGGAAGGRGKGGTAKKKPNPIYGATGGGSGVRSPHQPFTAPRLHSSKPQFEIREQQPATAPKPSSRPYQQQHSAAGQGQHDSSVHPMQLLTGREPAGRARLGRDNQPDAIIGEEDGPFQGRVQQWHPQQQEQPTQQQGPSRGPPWGDAHTPGRALQSHQQQPSAAPAHDGWGVGPPPTSYKTPANPLRALFHGGDTPATSASKAGTAGPAARAAPPPGLLPNPAREVASSGGHAPADTTSARGAESGSAEKASAAAGGGMSLQRAFVAALAPVSRTAQAQRQRGAGAAGGGLYGRLQALVATEKAQRGQHSAQRAMHARLTVLQRESEANLTKCLCRLETAGGESSRMVAAGTADAGSSSMLQQLARAGDSRVVAFFQSRTAREVDLVPGSCVVVPEGALRLLRGAGVGGGLPVLLCLAASQG